MLASISLQMWCPAVYVGVAFHCRSETTASLVLYTILLLMQPNVELPIWQSHHSADSC